MSRLVPLGCALALCACTQDFNKFLGDGGAADDASDAAATCDVSSGCIASVSTCGQGCTSSYNTCTQGCGQSQSCKAQCKNTLQSCDGTCVSTCVTCAGVGTCAQTPCQSAVP